MSDGNWNPSETWHRFRLETETVKHYPRSYALYIGQTHRDILLDQILPTTLYIKAACILDDSIAKWLTENGHTLKKPYRNDFNGRICYLNDNSLYIKSDDLHEIRRKRNSFAHEPRVHCTWDELEKGVSIIEHFLVGFDLAVETKALEYFGERSAMKESDDPKIKFTRKFSYGVTEEGEKALEIAWDQNFLN